MSAIHPSNQPDPGLAHNETDAHESPTRAIASGVVAALAAGGLWAVMVHLTGYEIGYAAWGVGLLVGLAMARATTIRSRQLAMVAAGCAVLGLLAGKAFIFWSSAGPLAGEFSQDDDLMRGVVAWRMYDERELEPATLEALDDLPWGETVSDEVWERMMDEAAPRLSAMTTDERDVLAKEWAQSALRQIGFWNGIAGQLSGFDLLWILLAVGSAYRIMLPRDDEEDETVIEVDQGVEGQRAEPESP